MGKKQLLGFLTAFAIGAFGFDAGCSTDSCIRLCKKTVDCFAGEGEPSEDVDVDEQCEMSCEQQRQEAADAGCTSENEELYDCTSSISDICSYFDNPTSECVEEGLAWTNCMFDVGTLSQ